MLRTANPPPPNKKKLSYLAWEKKHTQILRGLVILFIKFVGNNIFKSYKLQIRQLSSYSSKIKTKIIKGVRLKTQIFA